MSGGFGPGLLRGMVTTAKTMLQPSHTVEYPDAAPELPPRSRGVIALLEENCTSCMLCARECPDWCIYIDSHKETIPATTPGGRDRQRNVLDRFAIDFSLCMYCGICIEACPFDALYWSPQFEYAEVDIRDLLHEKDRLGEWMRTVPPPPALTDNAAEPAELVASRGPVAGAPGRERPARRRPPGGPPTETPPASPPAAAPPTAAPPTAAPPAAAPPLGESIAGQSAPEDAAE